MTKLALNQAFEAGLYLTELQCLLQTNLSIQLHGCPPGTYLALRHRSRNALRMLPVTAAKKDLELSVSEGLKLIQPRICYDADVGDFDQFEDATDAMKASHAPDVKKKAIRSQLQLHLNPDHNENGRNLIELSIDASSKLNVAMGEFRKTIEPYDFVCFTAGWAIGVVATYTDALLSFSKLTAADGGPISDSTLASYRDHLKMSLQIIAAFSDGLALPSHVESLASLSGIKCISMLYHHDTSLADATARSMQAVALEALTVRGLSSLFKPLFAAFINLYSDLGIAYIDRDVLESVDESRQRAIAADERYLKSNDLNDLNVSIAEAAATIGMSLTPEMLALSKEQLSRSLFERYQHIGDMNDIDQSVGLLLDCLDDFTPDDILVPTALANLGYILTVRFDRTRIESDIDMAIDALELTVDRRAGPIGRQVFWWANLANALRLKWRFCSHDIADIDEASALYKEVVRVTPVRWSDYESFRQNLANTEFNRTELVNDARASAIDQHVNVLRAVVRNLRGRPSPTAYANLGLSLRRQSIYKPEVKQEALDCLRTSVKLGLDGAVPQTLETAVNWGDLAFQNQSWHEAVEAYGHASSAVELLFRLQLNRAAQEKMLRSAQGVAADLAFSLIRSGRLDDALMTIEAGIGRMLANALEKNRADLVSLRDSGHADLFENYQSLSDQISASAFSESDRRGANGSIARTARVPELHRALDEVISRIRKVAGFEDFLTKMNTEQIRAAARDVIVYLFATSQGGIALVVSANPACPIAAVDLPAMTQNWVAGCASQLLAGQNTFYASEKTSDDFAAWSASLEKLLQNLWSAVMRPLLQQVESHPRIILIPVGLIQLLPLHAANGNGSENAFDKSQIFYAPNAFSLRTSAHARPSRDSMVVVQSTTSEYDNLPWAALELAAVKTCFPNVTCLDDKTGTPNAVLQQIVNASFLHFSCHGFANLLQPSESGLVLAYDEELTVKDLMNAGGTSASLALLLACETGVSGVSLPDEIVSLPTALQQAGTTAVVAALWSIDDLASALLAARFYHNWRHQGMKPPNAFLAAQRWLRDGTWQEFAKFINTPEYQLPEALTASIPVNFRQQPYADPLFWAPFYWTGSIH